MKKRNHLFLPRLALVSLGLLLLLSIACEKKDSPEKKSEQAVSTSAPAAVASPAVAEAKSTPSPSVPKDGANPRFFAAQENLLDAGGSFYLYADLQDVLKEEMQSVRNSIKGMPDAVEVERGLEITDRVIDLLGLYGLQDVGISSIPDGGLYRTKMFLNNTAGKDKGYMALLGDAPHALKILDRASSGTVLLYSADVNEMATWELIRGLVMNIGGGAALADMEKGLEELAKNEGIDIPKLLPTLGGEINVLVDQTPTQKLTLPLGNAGFTTDAPRLTLMVRLKSDDFYQALKAAFLKNNLCNPESTEGKVLSLAIKCPFNPFWPLTPVLATDGEYLYLSTHANHVKELVAGKPAVSLRESPEFKKISAGTPTEGNGCIFVSQRFYQAWFDAMQQVQASQGSMNVFQNFGLTKEYTQSSTFGVRVNRPDGMWYVERSRRNMAEVVPAVGLVVPGVLVGIAVPSFVKAREQAQFNRIEKIK